MNRKRERFKVFEVELRLNRDNIIIILIIILNIYKKIKLIKNRKINLQVITNLQYFLYHNFVKVMI